MSTLIANSPQNRYVLSDSPGSDIRGEREKSMHIRLASNSDCAGLARVQVDSYRTAYRGLLPDAYLDQFTYEEETQDWMNLLSKVDHDVVYVAVDDADHILGYALGRSLADSGFDCELLALHVLKDHQRQGIGTALVSVMASHYADTGCASLMLWTLVHGQD
jgi:ribosomal protein S18 acetylase RimI-like enzyme